VGSGATGGGVFGSNNSNIGGGRTYGRGTPSNSNTNSSSGSSSNGSSNSNYTYYQPEPSAPPYESVFAGSSYQDPNGDIELEYLEELDTGTPSPSAPSIPDLNNLRDQRLSHLSNKYKRRK
jgi:hypothetical protein